MCRFNRRGSSGSTARDEVIFVGHDVRAPVFPLIDSKIRALWRHKATRLYDNRVKWDSHISSTHTTGWWMVSKDGTVAIESLATGQ